MQCVLSCRVSEPDRRDRVPLARRELRDISFQNLTQPRSDLAVVPCDVRAGRDFIIRLLLTHSLPPLSSLSRGRRVGARSAANRVRVDSGEIVIAYE